MMNTMGPDLGLGRHTDQENPVQHHLAKLNTFKGENGERLDDFVYQVGEFATFHDWDPIETCRQARTNLRGVALAYIHRTPLPPHTWKELKDLLMHRFQPRDLTAAETSQDGLATVGPPSPSRDGYRPISNGA